MRGLCMTSDNLYSNCQCCSSNCKCSSCNCGDL